MKKRTIFSILVSITMGAFIGFNLIQINPEITFVGLSINIATIIIILLVFILVSTIIHELGHLIFGLLFGYKFLSFTILSLTLIKIDGHFVFKKGGIAGTGGQCLMEPIEKEVSLFQTVMYNLGGGLFNIILAIVLIAIDYSTPGLSCNLLLIRLFYITNLFMGISNLIPLKTGGIVNDGYNILMLFKDENSLLAINNTLRVSSRISNGFLYRDLPQEYVFYDPSFDYNNPLLTITLMTYINYLMEVKSFNQAYHYLEIAYNDFKEIIPYYYEELESDLIFFDILNDIDSDSLELKYKNFDKIVFKPNYSVKALRAKLAYSKLVTKDFNVFYNLLERYKTLLKQHQIKSDVLIEENLFELLNNHTYSELEIGKLQQFKVNEY